MISFVSRLLRLLSRRPIVLPADPFGEPPRAEPATADPFFEGVKAAAVSHLGGTPL